MVGVALCIREKLFQNPRAVLCRIPPQNRAEGGNRLFPFAVVCTEADVPDIGAQLLNDLVHVPKLLW